MNWMRMVKKKQFSVKLDEISPLSSLGFPSAIDNDEVLGWGQAESTFKIHRGPKISPYIVSQTVHKLNHLNIKCFICQELLNTTLADEIIVPLSCGSLVHEQCLHQIVECNLHDYNQRLFPPCYCSLDCQNKLIPKLDYILENILLSKSSSICQPPPVPPKNTNLSALAKTLVPHEADIRKNLDSQDTKYGPKDFALPLSPQKSPAFALPSIDPQIDDLWLTQDYTPILKLPCFPDTKVISVSASLPTLSDLVAPVRYSSDKKRSSSLSKLEDGTITSPIPLKKSQLPSVLTSLQPDSPEGYSDIDRKNSVSKSVFSSRFSTSTIDTTTPKIESYKNIPLDILKNRFIKHLLESCPKFTYTQLIQSGCLRLVDKLLISFDNYRWQEELVYLFENYLVIWNKKNPTLIDVSNVSIVLPSHSILKLIFGEGIKEIWLNSHIFQVIEKWVVAISDKDFNFPSELISSTVELPMEDYNTDNRDLHVGVTKEQTKPSNVCKNEATWKRTQNFAAVHQLFSPNLSINCNKVDNHLRLNPSNNYDADQSQFSDDTEVSETSDFDSDQELIDELVLKNLKSEYGSKWLDLIKNIDDCIHSKV